MNTEIINKAANPVLIFWMIMGLAGFFILPWYGVEDFFLFEWLTDGYPFDTDYAPAGFLLLQKEKNMACSSYFSIICSIYSI